MSKYELSKLSYKNPILLTCTTAVASCRNVLRRKNVTIVNLKKRKKKKKKKMKEGKKFTC